MHGCTTKEYNLYSRVYCALSLALAPLLPLSLLQYNSQAATRTQTLFLLQFKRPKSYFMYSTHRETVMEESTGTDDKSVASSDTQGHSLTQRYWAHYYHIILGPFVTENLIFCHVPKNCLTFALTYFCGCYLISMFFPHSFLDENLCFRVTKYHFCLPYSQNL